MGEVRLVLNTMGSARQAKDLGRLLVEEGLAACVTLLPGCVSIYRWEGEVQEEPECLLLIKTVDERLDELERRLSTLHPYDLPEFVALEPAAVSEGYLAWLLEGCRVRPGL